MRLNREDAPHWTLNPGRGGVRGIRLLVRVALVCGRTVMYPIVHLGVLYFVIVSRRSRQVSRAYLRRALGHEPRWRDIYRHHWHFACTLIDRVFLLAGRTDDIEVRPVCGEQVLALLRAGPCLLLGAHHGSFEALRGLANRHPTLAVRPLMYRDQHQPADRVLQAIDSGQAEHVIAIGGFTSLLTVQEAVANGESVGLLGDRCPPQAPSIFCRLLDGDVALPEGPLRIAHALRLPVVLAFALHRGWGRYEAHFEVFDEAPRLPAGAARREALAGWLQAYADRLGAYCRMAPYNWFNFYDFWYDLDNGSSGSATAATGDGLDRSVERGR